MTGVIISLCVAVTFIMLAVMLFFKGSNAIVTALTEVVTWAYCFLIGVVVYFASRFLAILFGGAATWGLVFKAIGIGILVVGGFFAVTLGLGAVYLAGDILNAILGKLGEYSENGLKSLIGFINKHIPLS